MPLLLPNKEQDYTQLSLSEDSSESTLVNLEKNGPLRFTRPFYAKPLPWVLSTLCLVLINFSLLIKLWALQRFGTYGTGFQTEFGSYKLIPIKWSSQLIYS